MSQIDVRMIPSTSKIKQRLDVLEKKMGELDVSDLKTQLEQVRELVGEINDRLSKTEEQASALEDRVIEVSDLTNQIKDIEAQIDKLINASYPIGSTSITPHINAHIDEVKDLLTDYTPGSVHMMIPISSFHWNTEEEVDTWEFKFHLFQILLTMTIADKGITFSISGSIKYEGFVPFGDVGLLILSTTQVSEYTFNKNLNTEFGIYNIKGLHRRNTITYSQGSFSEKAYNHKSEILFTEQNNAALWKYMALATNNDDVITLIVETQRFLLTGTSRDTSGDDVLDLNVRETFALVRQVNLDMLYAERERLLVEVPKPFGSETLPGVSDVVQMVIDNKKKLDTVPHYELEEFDLQAQGTTSIPSIAYLPIMNSVSTTVSKEAKVVEIPGVQLQYKDTGTAAYRSQVDAISLELISQNVMQQHSSEQLREVIYEDSKIVIYAIIDVITERRLPNNLRVLTEWSAYATGDKPGYTKAELRHTTYFPYTNPPGMLCAINRYARLIGIYVCRKSTLGFTTLNDAELDVTLWYAAQHIDAKVTSGTTTGMTINGKFLFGLMLNADMMIQCKGSNNGGIFKSITENKNVPYPLEYNTVTSQIYTSRFPFDISLYNIRAYTRYDEGSKKMTVIGNIDVNPDIKLNEAYDSGAMAQNMFGTLRIEKEDWHKIIGVKVSGKVSVNNMMFPIDIDLNYIYNNNNTQDSMLLEFLYSTVMNLWYDMQDVKWRLGVIERNIEQLWEAMTPEKKPLWKKMLAYAFDFALSYVPVGIGAMGTLLYQSSKRNPRAVNDNNMQFITGIMGNDKKNTSKYEKVKHDVDSGKIKMHTTNEKLYKDQAIASSHEQSEKRYKTELTDFIAGTSEFAGGLMQIIDPGGIGSLVNRINSLGMQSYQNVRHNKNKHEPSTEEAASCYIQMRPLASLGGPGKVVHKVITSGNKEQQLRYALNQNPNTRLPSHALMTTNRTYQTKDGTYIVSTVTGIGEANSLGMPTGDKGAGIGGHSVHYKVVGVSSKGGLIVTPLGPERSGLKDDDVRRLYTTMFPGAIPDVDTAWRKIAQKTTHQVSSGDKFTKVDVTPSDIIAIEQFIKNPTNWKYNLLNNNCQHYVSDLVSFMQGHSSPRNPEMQDLLEWYRVNIILNGGGESHARVAFHRRLIHH